MNPLVLKTDLVASGVAVRDGLHDRLRLADSETLAVDVELPDGVTASVPILRDSDESSAYRLVVDADRIYLERPDDLDDGPGRILVDVRPVPLYYASQTASGVPMHRIVERRGRILVVTPLGRCGYSIVGRPCTFCVEGGRSTPGSGPGITPADVVEAVSAAVREAPVDVVLFNTDSAEGDDGGVAFLTPYIQAVRRHVRVLVAAQLHPPRSVEWVDRSYALGLDAISYGLEIFDAGIFGRLCVGRSRYIGRDRYLDMLARAVTVFPSGAVWSELVVGVEPVAQTAAGIDLLADIGVVPVLSIPRSPYGFSNRPTPQDVSRLVTHLAEATTARQIPITWVRQLGASITPSDARLLDDAHRGSGARAATRLAMRGAHLLSRVRRRLRVRRADGSAGAH